MSQCILVSSGQLLYGYVNLHMHRLLCTSAGASIADKRTDDMALSLCPTAARLVGIAVLVDGISCYAASALQ